MENTPNYNLKKPGYQDFANIEILNENMDTIDTALNDLANSSDVTQLRNDLDGHIANMAQHNQIMQGAQKVQLVFGINQTLNCLTIEEVNI